MSSKLLHEKKGDITLSPTSADRQIDSLIISFEEDALEVEEDQIVPEGASIRASLSKLLKEEEKEDDVVGDEQLTTKQSAHPLTPKINLDQFTASIAKLIETYTKRLDIETVIYNRAKQYLQDEHGEEAVLEFDEVLVAEYDIHLADGAEEEDAPTTYAAGAGPSPG